MTTTPDQLPDRTSVVIVGAGPAGLTTVAPLPDAAEPDRYRVVATLDTAPEHAAASDIQAILDPAAAPGPAAAEYRGHAADPHPGGPHRTGLPPRRTRDR